MDSCFHWTVYNISYGDVHIVDIGLHAAMVLTYIRKSNRAQYSRSDMLQALTAIQNGEISKKMCKHSIWHSSDNIAEELEEARVVLTTKLRPIQASVRPGYGE